MYKRQNNQTCNFECTFKFNKGGKSSPRAHFVARCPFQRGHPATPRLNRFSAARICSGKSGGEKRPSRFSFIGDAHNSCACAGIMRVSDKRKTARPFFASRLTRANPSSGKSVQTGRCGVSPLEGAARNEVRARGRLSPFIKFERTFEIASLIILSLIHI